MCEPSTKCKESIENLRSNLNDVISFLSQLKCPKAQDISKDSKKILESLPHFPPTPSKDNCKCTDCKCDDAILEQAANELMAEISQN